MGPRHAVFLILNESSRLGARWTLQWQPPVPPVLLSPEIGPPSTPRRFLDRCLWVRVGAATIHRVVR
eukprot:11688005-Alexandrium_andersonii.AAC.1